VLAQIIAAMLVWRPGREVVEVLVRFTGFRGRYVAHCHNLEHEDMAMMANIDIV
jgi:FtsP/CotA-like multicopper oxidase with cupredoxin domain